MLSVAFLLDLLLEKHIKKMNNYLNIFLAKLINNILLKLIIFLCATFIILAVISTHNSFIYSFLSHFCHQNIDRSFCFHSCSLGICSRCFGIYLGMFLYGIYLLKYKKIVISIFFLSIFASILSIFLKYFNLDTDNFSRFFLGILNGVLLIIILYKIEEFYTIIFQKILITIERVS